MKIKKYTANSMPEAMQLIRTELGDEAVILNSKEIETGGFFGFFTKKKLEVIVAIEKEQRRRPAPIRTETVAPPVQRKNVIEQKDVLDELSELRQLVQRLSEQIDGGHNGAIDYPLPFQSVDQKLKSQAVSEAVRLKIMKHLLKQWSEQTAQEMDAKDIAKELNRFIEEKLSQLPFGGISFQKKIVTIVGPTGVGKTTTIAKIAAHCVLKKQKKVALMTTDTYRIAAVEQLKTYAKILNIPLEVAYSIDDFKKAVDQFEQYDLIIVDSAGRNFRNRLYIEELSKVINFEQEAETFLTLSLTSKYEDMKEIVNQFAILPINQVILTKEDETSSHGAMLNIPLELGKGIAYITNGQNVPDDFLEAAIPYIKQCVLGEKDND